MNNKFKPVLALVAFGITTVTMAAPLTKTKDIVIHNQTGYTITVSHDYLSSGPSLNNCLVSTTLSNEGIEVPTNDSINFYATYKAHCKFASMGLDVTVHNSGRFGVILGVIFQDHGKYNPSISSIRGQGLMAMQNNKLSATLALQ